MPLVSVVGRCMQGAAAEKERSTMEEATKQIDKALFHAGEEVEGAQDRCPPPLSKPPGGGPSQLTLTGRWR